MARLPHLPQLFRQSKCSNLGAYLDEIAYVVHRHLLDALRLGSRHKLLLETPVDKLEHKVLSRRVLEVAGHNVGKPPLRGIHALANHVEP